MPFVHVELIEGRTEEQLTNMVKDITEAVSKNAGAPKENIHVHKAANGKNKFSENFC